MSQFQFEIIVSNVDASNRWLQTQLALLFYKLLFGSFTSVEIQEKRKK
jgi:hypothetical protein